MPNLPHFDHILRWEIHQNVVNLAFFWVQFWTLAAAVGGLSTLADRLKPVLSTLART